MRDIIFLSGFYLLSLLASVWSFSHMEVEETRVQSSTAVSSRQFNVGVVISIILFAGIGVWVIQTSSVDVIQGILLGAFALAWMVSVAYTLHVKKTWFKLGLAAVIGSFLLLITLLSENQLITNIFIAGAMLWVGPVLIRRYRLRFRFINMLLVLIMLFDIWYIFIANGAENVIGQPLFFNGLVAFGNQGLGAGDILISYLLVNTAQRWRTRTAAVVLAVLCSLVPPLIYLFPTSSSVVLPFTMFIIPIAWVVYVLSGHSKAVSVSTR